MAVHSRSSIHNTHLGGSGKDPYEAKYQYLINIHEKAGLIIIMIPKLLWIIQMIYKSFTKILKNIIQEKKRKVLIVFDDMVADMISDKKLNPIVSELFIRKFQIKESFSKLLQIIHQILTLKIL